MSYLYKMSIIFLLIGKNNYKSTIFHYAMSKNDRLRIRLQIVLVRTNHQILTKLINILIGVIASLLL